MVVVGWLRLVGAAIGVVTCVTEGGVLAGIDSAYWLSLNGVSVLM